jgi:NAD(P)H dehydrogenase (quinone)
MALVLPFPQRRVLQMRAHIVVAHTEPQSYNAHLAHIGRQALEAKGWSVTVSDLYQMDFNPCERASHYVSPLEPKRFDVQSEQRHASNTNTVPADVAAEITRLEQADLLILQYPMWWHLPPAILKGCLDRVFIYGNVYTSKQRFEDGRFVGKKAMLSVTVGTSEETYAFNGRSGDIDLLLWPINFSLAYVGYQVIKPFVAYGVEAGLRCSEAATVDARLKQISVNWVSMLGGIEQSPTLPFNMMSHWGSDGRIKSDAPIHSPFMRHREQLELF